MLDFLEKITDEQLNEITIKNVLFDKITVCSRGIIFLTREFDDFKIIDAIKTVALGLEIDIQDIIILQERNEKFFQLSIIGSKYVIDDKFYTDFEKREEVISNADYLLSDIQGFNTKKNDKIREYPDGSVYIKNKQGVWTSASDKDTLEEFKTTLYGGMFGLHKFKEKKYLDGILYLLSAGLFCLGYIEEMMCFWFDCKKDELDRYMIPLNKETKKMFIVPQIIMLVLNVVLCIVYFYVLRNLL